MRTNIGCVAVMLGMMSVVTGAAAVGENNVSLAEKRGLSPIIRHGQNPQNPYTSINTVLGKLGIVSSPVAGHNTHFHVYIEPPKLLEIGPHNLLADNSLAMPPDSTSAPEMPAATLQTVAQGLFDYTQTLITGDELMFTMDVPVIPAQYTPIVLAQAAAPVAGATLQPDYILNTCKETESMGDPMSAMRGVDPAGLLAVYLQNHDKRTVDMAMLAAIKTTLLQGTKHGKIFSEVDNVGLTSYHYDPEPEYVGNDKAVFMAEFEGKVYKIVVELHVFITVGENDPSATSCPPLNSSKLTANRCLVLWVSTLAIA